MASVRIRMFRQGLGDCFLLTFDTDIERPRHVLIDCGVLKGTPDAGERMERVAAGIAEATGGRLDVVVATHQHWDHVSGFLQARERFGDLRIDDAWLAWTEDPTDGVAGELRERRRRALQALEGASDKLERALGASPRVAAIRALLGFEEGLAAAGRATTAAAMAWAAERRTGRTPFLRPGDQLSPEESGLGGGVRTYVLGPPRDVRQIRRSDPSRRTPEVYELAAAGRSPRGFYAAAEAAREADEHDEHPFVRFYRVPPEEATRDERLAGYFAEGEAWRRIDHDWLDVTSQLALALNSDTNNTSLVLAFELGPGGPVLLFPGDAQVGNWLSWGELSWSVDDGGAQMRTVTGEDLLRRTALYKVGHHGSHNATLRERGLELMSRPDLVAMMPVDRTTAGKMEWQMPFGALFRRLQEKTEGRILDADLGIAGEGHGDRWDRFVGAVAVEDLWIDYRIEW